MSVFGRRGQGTGSKLTYNGRLLLDADYLDYASRLHVNGPAVFRHGCGSYDERHIKTVLCLTNPSSRGIWFVATSLGRASTATDGKPCWLLIHQEYYNSEAIICYENHGLRKTLDVLKSRSDNSITLNEFHNHLCLRLYELNVLYAHALGLREIPKIANEPEDYAANIKKITSFTKQTSLTSDVYKAFRHKYNQLLPLPQRLPVEPVNALPSAC